MNVEQIAIVFILLATLGLFVWGRWRFDVVAMTALMILTLAGIVPVADAFAGFGHPAVITVASVLVIGRAVYRSGVVEAVARRISRATRHASGQVMLLSGVATVGSAIMNNVAAVTLLMPVAVRSAEVANRPVSQVLMPLSFASLLGGLTTLMGTPPNIIIANQRAAASGEAFSVFDFTPVGLGVAIVGILFISLVGWRLIPSRRQKSLGSERLFEISDYVSEARIPEGSPIAGRPVHEFAKVTKIDARVVALIRRGRSMVSPPGSATLLGGDVLILEGDPHVIQAVASKNVLEIHSGEKVTRRVLQSDDVLLIEAVISPGSALEDRPASPARFRRVHGANLLAVSRQGRPIWRGLRDLRLRIGDVLLLHGHKETLPEVLASLGCLPLAERESIALPNEPNLVPIGIFGIGIAAAALGILPVQIAFAATAVLLIVLEYMPVREIYTSIDWPVVVLVGALLPVGQALQTSGVTELLAQSVLATVVSLPVLVLLALVIAVSMALSDVINNAAAAIVMAPFAITLARDLGASPDALLMAVAVGCSCTFLTPIGHQSNTLVMGPGGYRFGDYWRLGLPLDVLVVATASLLIWAVWV